MGRPISKDLTRFVLSFLQRVAQKHDIGQLVKDLLQRMEKTKTERDQLQQNID